MDNPNQSEIHQYRRVALIMVGAIIAFLLVFSVAVIANPEFLSTRLATIERQGQEGDDAIIAIVNGEPIMFSWIEAVKVSIQSGALVIDDQEAYEEALRSQIRQKLLFQEAERRGLTVNDEEIKAYDQQQKRLMDTDPVVKRIIESYWQARGDVDEAKMLESTRKLLLLGKIKSALYEEAPPPTEAEIEEYLSSNPTNGLQLLAVEFDSKEQAEEIYKALEDENSSTQADLFTVFIEQAMLLNAMPVASASPVTDFQGQAYVDALHQHFTYGTATELPDYAQQALTQPGKAIGLSETTSDHIIVYMLLGSIVSDSDAALVEIRRELSKMTQDAHVQAYVERLAQDGDIQIYYDRLPEIARPQPDGLFFP